MKIQPAIHFYRPLDTNGYLSNFYGSPITINGQKWQTVEHYFQAMKSHDTVYQARVQQCPTPRDAFRMGRQVTLRKDWEMIKLNVMEQALTAKFTQHKNLQRQLLETGQSVIVEHTERDSFWGDGGDGEGENWLGLLLMKVREQIRNAGLQ